MVATATTVNVSANTRAASSGLASTSGRGRQRSNEGSLSVQQGLYENGAKVLCHANFDSRAHTADIIEQRVNQAGVSYYVHYVDYDKRLDEWVNEDRVLGYADGSQPGNLTSLPSVVVGDDHKMTRRLKRKYDEINHVAQDVHDLAPLDQQLEQEHQERTKVKNIQSVELGKYEIFTWYYSPYPEPYNQLDKLYVCEFCLKYFRKRTTFVRHGAKCEFRHPPGDEIYRSPPKRPGAENDDAVADPTIAVFEVDGSKHKIYCQSLCLLSKLFLDHKTLYYDVDPFLFYILCEEINGVYHIVGYFSKEKHSTEDYNLACILVFPPYQKKGYGGFQMQFSYELTKKEGKIGTPERPLSDLGQVAYRGYWQRVLLQILRKNPQVSIKELVDITAIRTDDVVKTLNDLNCIKYWKGEHIIAPQGRIIEDTLEDLEKKKVIGIDVSRLHWTPFSTVQPTLPAPGVRH